MAESKSTGAPERPPADILPAIFRLEQGVQAFSDRLEQQQGALLALLTAYHVPAPSLETAARLHAENIGHLTALRCRLQSLRHQLSRVLP